MSEPIQTQEADRVADQGADASGQEASGSVDQERQNAYREESIAEIRAKHESLVAKLTKEVQRLNDELVAVRVQYRQQVEEFEKARARIETEAVKEVERQNERVLKPFLGVVDDLERATEAAEQSARDRTILNGVRLVWGNLLRILLGFDVRALDALGAPFDAALHEAVATTHVDDPARVGTVVEVVQTGYLIGDRVLRPAKVVVGKSATA